MRLNRILLIPLTFLAAALFITSCATVTAEYSIMQSDISFTLKVRRDLEGNATGELYNSLLPAADVRGDIEETEEGLIFYVTGVRFFANWPNGWTEGIYEASGSYLVTFENGGARLQLRDEVTLWDIAAGEIRYFDTYYRGENGFTKVKNRIDRMTEISRFLKTERDFPPFYRDYKNGTGKIAAFLFPELKGSPAEGEDSVLGAGIRWDSGYTDEILPEQYGELRNSGTLWRDYEEAAGLFYTIYNFDYVLNEFMQGGGDWR